MDAQGVLRAQAEAALAATVRMLEIRHTGGTPFFDALDAELRQPYWYRVLFLRYLDEFPDRPIPVVSGRFGIGYATWFSESDWRAYAPLPIVLPGDLRHNTLPALNFDAAGHEFAFLDDSYYKGRTYGQIRDRLRECGGRVLGALVLYDGSPAPLEVPSFYRYHA